MGCHTPAFPDEGMTMMKLWARGLGAALVAAVVLVPRVTIADEVSDEERRGEWDEDGQGQRFGAISVHGDFVATANSPSGWALVRTYENKGDEAAHVVVEERITQTDQVWGARVGAEPQVVLTRTQKLDLKPKEKKTIGVYVSAELGQRMTASAKVEAGIHSAMDKGQDYPMREYQSFAVDYLRPLNPGETRAKPPVYDRDPTPDSMPGPPDPSLVSAL